MTDAKSPEPSPEGAPARLTRRALFDLGLEDMRRRGEPTEGMSKQAPTPSYSSEDSKERAARVFALLQANGITSFSSAEIARQKRVAEECQRSAAEARRRWFEYMRQPPSDASPVRGSPPISHPSSRHSGAGSDAEYRDRLQLFDPFQRIGNDSDPRLTDGACGGSAWRHSTELRLLKEEMIEAAKFRPEQRELFRTFDMNAFEAALGTKIEDDAARCPAVPADFPPHQTIDGLADLGAYLASSAYIVSLGGPPLPDLKYGIIVVPAGEEALLFAGYGDHAAMPTDFKEQVYAKSKAAQQEQEMELRQKAAEEVARGVGSEPEIDDDDRAFYRRRWRERNSLPTDSIDDMDVARSDRDAAGSRSAHAPGDGNSAPSIRGDVPASANENQTLSVRTPAALVDGAVGTPSIPGAQEQNLEPHGASAGGEVSSPHLSGSRRDAEVPVDADVRVEHVPTDSSNEGDGKVDGQARPVTSTDTTVQTSAQDVALSPDALNALERLLGGGGEGGRKRKRTRRVLDSLLKKQPDRIVAHRSVLLEVARAATSLADGQLCKNPGIDPQLWETIQVDLALKATPCM